MRRTAKTLALGLALSLGLTLAAPLAGAKTISSAGAENLFFYAEDGAGKNVLIDVIPMEDLKAAAGEEHYHFSVTDNYPTTQYCEAVGLTIPELVELAAARSDVRGASALRFEPGGEVAFMATDSYGNYSRTWSWEVLYGVKRYYFEGLFGADGWKSAWEIAGEDNAKYGVDLETYNAEYRDSDPYYADKRAVFEAGVETPVLLATESYSGRTTSSTLVASTEPGIAAQIAANGGTAAGSLRDMLSDETALRFCLPMTEADLMAAHRTAYDNFKWIYNIRLAMESSPITSLGTVAAPTASFSLSGDTLTITASCATAGAQLYYSFDGAPQIPYTGPVTYDTGGRDLSADPVTFYLTAVKPGYDDAGVTALKYPQSGVTFQTLYSGLTGQDAVFTAEEGVSSADWDSWSGAVLGVSMKAPGGSSYAALKEGQYALDGGAKTVTLDRSLFTEDGAYSFIIYARGFANKTLSLSVKRGAPALAGVTAPLGSDVAITFDDPAYQNGLYLYLAPEGGEGALISSSYVDRTAEGRAVIRAAWFALDSCPVKEPGRYTLEVVNSGYSPASQTITLTLTEPGEFTDVEAGAWYAGAVSWVVEQGLFNGTGNGRFSPGGAMTRSMFATVFHRLAGSPAPAAPAPFTDVEAGSWYGAAVAWAAEQGHLTGTGGGRFSPEEEITLGQMAAVLWRYAGSPAAASAVPDSLGAVSDWAASAMSWAAETGLLDGVEGSLSAQAPATRAQVAQVMMNNAQERSA